MMKYANFYAWLFAFISCTCHGQNKATLHRDTINYTMKDTVTAFGPSRMIRNIIQARNGAILMAASYAGIFSYNGQFFRNLTTQLGPRRYWNVLEDRLGHIWIATTDSGVYQYNGQSFHHFTTREGLASNSVFSICEDRVGHVWFGTGNGLSRYDGQSFRNFSTRDGLSNNNIHTVMEDRTGKLWVGTGGDACIYDGNTFSVLKNKEGKTFYNVWSIMEDRKGNIWFGASIIDDKKDSTLFLSNGLWRYDGRTFTKVANRDAAAIIEDKEGNVWTTGSSCRDGVDNWTFSRYEQKSLYAKTPIVTDIMSIKKMLCGIFEAADGSIWFGSINGVYRYDGKTITDFRSQPHPN